MNSPDPFAAVERALGVAREAWESSVAAGPAVDGLSGAPLAMLNDAVASLRRSVDAVHVQVAADIARASRVELGNAGLAKQQGFRTPAAMIAAATGASTGDAGRMVAVGEAIAPRMTLSGADAPARHPEVARGLAAGRLSVAAAAAIVALLDRVALRADRDTIAQAEATLVVQAEGLTLDQLQKILQRAEAWLDPDGVEPHEDDLRAQESAHIYEDRNGMLVINAKFAPENGAPVKTAIDAMVGAELRHRDEGARRRARAADDALRADDRRTVAQLQADALATICRHVLGCDRNDVPTAGATVVVRIDAEALHSGIGHATIDGISQPVSVATARRMAAAGAIIPCVLGGDSEILDFGRARRLFTPAQKTALIERDGGCAMCGLPPGMTQVHHVRWWERDTGPTDLNNGMLLCVRCHHRIHDDGWTIRIDGAGIRARVWFTPPAHVDIERTPRLGGRARYDYAA